ncbi:MAG: glycosyltransferase [Candidatus Velthaea sp.]
MSPVKPGRRIPAPAQGPVTLTAKAADCVSQLHIGFFTECYRPIVNGIVASIDALRSGLETAGVAVTTVAPRFPHFDDEGGDIVRIPSLPLPTATAYRLCVPYVRTVDRSRVRDLAIVHTHSPFVTGWMGANHARRRGIPLVFTYHTRIEAYAHYVPFEQRTMQAAAVTLTRSYANAADVVIVPTLAMESRLRELGVHSTIAVVPSSIDVERFAGGRRSPAVRALLGARDDDPLALVVSRLAREKNLELAIDALAYTRETRTRLAIVGEGPYRPALEERAREAGVAARVRFVGALPSAALPDVYASGDAFVFPSTTETQGLVLAEALAAGLRVVAIDTPASRDVLAGQGRLVPPHPRTFAQALDDAFAAGRDESAVRLAHSRYTVGLQTQRVLDVYRGLLSAEVA